MQENIVRILLIIVGITQFLPVIGVISSEKLSGAYGVSIDNPDLEILMRHRAVLFGLLGAFIFYAVFNPQLWNLAFIAAFISIFSFFWLAFTVGEFNASIRKIVVGDMVAAVALVAAIVLSFYKSSA